MKDFDEVEEKLFNISVAGGYCLHVLFGIDRLLSMSGGMDEDSISVIKVMKEHKEFYQTMVAVGFQRFTDVCVKAGIDPMRKSLELEKKIEKEMSEHDRDVGL